MKQEFNYEVTDFVPTKKKKRLGKILGIIIAIILATVACVAVLILKAYNTPETVVASSLLDFYDYTIGEKSIILENLDLKTFDKALGENNLKISLNAKLKELGDMGLGGYEKYASGASITATCLTDKDKRNFSGELQAGYSLFSINLLQASFTDHTLAIGSKDFFDEVFGAELVGIVSHLSQPKHRLVKELGGNRYEITALDQYLPEGDKLSMLVTINGKRQLTEVSVSLKGDAHFEKFELDMKLKGKRHPSDIMDITANIVYEGQAYDAVLHREADRSKSVKEDHVSVSLNLDGLEVSADTDMTFDKSSKEITYRLKGSDGVDVLDLSAEGTLTADEIIEFYLKSVKIVYSDEFIAELKTNLKLEPSKTEIKCITDNPDKIIDIFELNRKISESVIGQIIKHVDSYMKIINSF